MEKYNKLTKLIEQYSKNDMIIAFSGGVDSSLLLKIAADCSEKYKNKVYAVTIHSMLNSVKETNFTREFAEKMGVIHKIIEIDELKETEIINNPKDRCYICKRYMFSKILDFAKTADVQVVLEGTNSDDLKMYRPGIKATYELGIISPLKELGFTKEDVRTLAELYGISTSKKPSSPCLATRFEYGTKLCYENIQKVERAEEYIKALGFYNVRLRVHGEIARIEVDLENISELLKVRDSIVGFIKKLGFKYVTVDLEGFLSGSMDK